MLAAAISIVLGATVAYEGLTYLLWYYENRVHGAFVRRGSRLPYVTAWLADWAALLFVLAASLLGWFGGLMGRAPMPCSAGTPVVLVHGWGTTAGAMALIAARLRRDGRHVYSAAYPSIALDIEESARALAAVLRDLARLNRMQRLDILTYGRGAVVLRAAARQGCGAILRNVVTLGAPHQGCALAALLDHSCLRQLSPHSRYLTQLNEDAEAFCKSSEWTSIYSTFDAIVFPTELAYQSLGLNIGIDWIGHHAMLLSERVYRLAKENLDVETHEA